MNILFILRSLRKRLWLLLSVPIVFGILAFFLTLDFKKSYKSNAQLSTGITISDPFDDERYNVFEERIQFNNLIATLHSPVVISLLSYNLILNELEGESPFVVFENEEQKPKFSQADLEIAKNIFREKLENFETLSTFNKVDLRLLKLLASYGFDDQTLRNNLVVYREGQTDYLTIVYSSQLPELSAFVVNTLSREFIRYHNSIQSSRTNESVDIYEKLVTQKRKILEVKANALEQFKSTQGVLNFDIESENKVAQIAQAENALAEERKNSNGLRLSLKEVNRQVLETQNLLARGSSSSIGSTTNSETNIEILNLQDQIRDLNQRYIVSGLSNQYLLDSLNLLRQRLVSLLNNNNNGSQLSRKEHQERLKDLEKRKNNLEIELAVAEENISSISASLIILRSNAGNYASKEARISELQRDLELATQEYQTAQEKYNNALDFAISSNTKIRQVLFGQPAVVPEPSKRLIITGLSGITSFIICLLVIGFLSYIDVSIKTPSNFIKMVDIKLIGAVNQIDMKKNKLLHIFFRSNANDKSMNTFRELFRKVRYEVENSNKKILLVSSSKRGSGKSTMVEALAYTLSLSNKKVLIIDSNFSNNTLTKQYKAAPVLEEFVSRDNSNNQYDKVITKTAIPFIDIIGCKGGSYSPTEIFPDDNFSKYLNCFKNEYDYVLLEGPSINEYSDSRELSGFVEGVLVVFSAKSEIKQNDRESIDFLKNMNGKLVGAILNQVEAEDIEQ